MDIRNCKRCGGLYNFNGTAVCNNCAKQEQEDFDTIRDYLFEHPNSTAPEISQATKIDMKIISRFLKEGRLRYEGKEGVLNCERCGETIETGRFCKNCLQELQTELKGSNRPGTSVNNNTSAGINKGNINTPWSQAKVHTYEHILKKKD